MLDDEVEKDELKSEGNEEGETSYGPDEESQHGDSVAASDGSGVSEVSDELDDDQDDEALEVPAAVRKHYNSLTGMPHPQTESQTRSGRTDEHDASNTALYAANHRGGSACHPDPEQPT